MADIQVGSTVTIDRGHNSVKGRTGKVTAVVGTKVTIQLGTGRTVDAPLSSVSLVGAAASPGPTTRNPPVHQPTRPTPEPSPSPPTTGPAPAPTSRELFHVGDTVEVTSTTIESGGAIGRREILSHVQGTIESMSSRGYVVSVPDLPSKRLLASRTQLRKISSAQRVSPAIAANAKYMEPAEALRQAMASAGLKYIRVSRSADTGNLVVYTSAEIPTKRTAVMDAARAYLKQHGHRIVADRGNQIDVAVT
jgi:ribosomal protein L21E